MKRRSLFLLPLCCLFLSSCFDLEETYTLHENGSYTANYSMDMGSMMSMLKSMIPDSAKRKAELGLEKDTLINFSESIPDSVRSKLNNNEQKLIDHTQMQLNMNINQFKVGFTNTGNSLQELQYFFSDFGSVMKKMKVGKMLIPTKLADKAKNDDEKDLSIGNTDFEYIITNNSFERKLKNQKTIGELEKKKQDAEMMKKMNIKMMSTLIINLPRPAKSIENSIATLSQDRKQFKLVVDLMEIDSKPHLLNFKINY